MFILIYLGLFQGLTYAEVILILSGSPVTYLRTTSIVWYNYILHNDRNGLLKDLVIMHFSRQLSDQFSQLPNSTRQLYTCICMTLYVILCYNTTNFKSMKRKIFRSVVSIKKVQRNDKVLNNYGTS